MAALPFCPLLQAAPPSGSSSLTLWVALGGGVCFIALVFAIAGFVLLFGRGARLRRGLNQSQQLQREGKWQESLALVRTLQLLGKGSNHWEKRLRYAEGECYRVGGQKAIQAGQFEEGLEQLQRAATLCNGDAELERAKVVGAMLGRVRLLVADGADPQAAHEIIARTLLVDAGCQEAYFWQGLCHVRQGNTELAQQALARSRGELEVGGKDLPAFVDPSLYLGGLLLKKGQPKEALRYLTEAYRIDGNSALVGLQLGSAMVTAGNDPSMAIRALQKALGPRGLLPFKQEPNNLWSEGFAEGKSFVRRLASKHAFNCPLWGRDVAALMRVGNLGLAQAFYRQGNYQDSANLFEKIMGEAAPSLPMLRGLGLALAKLGRYDQAFKHLRAAYDLEQPPQRDTAGYLALCGACGKTTDEETKIRNVLWAVRLVNGFTAPGDAEWVALISRIYAEARALHLGLAVEDHLYLCEHLLSVSACDPQAAEAFHDLASQHPEAVHAEYAFLYCRAAQQHNLTGPHAVDLFARAFAAPEQAHAFFEQRDWNFDDVEFAFLERAAAQQPGAFPAVLGPDYGKRGEKLLLERAIHEEKQGRIDSALTAVTVLLKLNPQSLGAHDRAACLHYRKGQTDKACELLQACHALQPTNPWPLSRLAMVQHDLGWHDSSHQSIRQAMACSRGRRRAEIALLGARLALSGKAIQAEQPHVAVALELLAESRKDDPTNAQALWVSAALFQVFGQREALVSLAPLMKPDEAADGRYQFLTCVSRIAAGDADGALEIANQLSFDPEFGTESGYLAGWANIYRQDASAAAESLREVARQGKSPAAPHAQALLGAIRFHQGAFDESIVWWTMLDAKRRGAWGFTDPLRGTVFLSALAKFEAEQFEDAAERFREAGKLGYRDQSLGKLLMAALVKAGQQALQGDKKQAGESANGELVELLA